jgi:glycosyltransferase involved in cell wall biosynthesis
MSKKILILSTWDNQGSGVASYKIGKFLLEAGYKVALVVRDRSQSDSFIIQITQNLNRKIFNRLTARFKSGLPTYEEYDFLNPDENYSFATAEQILESLPFRPDMILTGLISGFVNTEVLAELSEKTGAPVYMFMVDMAPLTGGCHYAWDCTGYEQKCRNCPAIVDESKKDVAHHNFALKQKNVKKGNLKVIAGSEWSKKQAQRSTLFKSQNNIYNINSCIDTKLFNNSGRDYAKRIFQINIDSKVVFTGSAFTHGKRKGIGYFVESLEQLWQLMSEAERNKIVVLIAANHGEKNDLIERIPFKKQLIDYIKDYRLLSLAYQASDVFVCSSVEDAGPMMVSEALACGTPVVGFEMGVTSNMVRNGYNGYKAKLKDSADLAAGMFKVLSLPPEKYAEYSRNAINQVEEFSSYKLLLSIVAEILNRPSA